MERVAVIVPVFDRADLLVRAIRSLRGQTRPPDEVVVVDDASSEDLSAARGMAEEAGYRWISRLRNGGPGAARNEGAAATASEWLAFLDSDDEWLPGKLEAQVAWHGDHPDVGISHVRESWWRNGKEVAKPSHWREVEGDLFPASVERCSIGPSCVLMRRGLWNRAGGFDERFRVCEDYELWLRITLEHRVGLAGDAPLVRKYGGHADQLSTTVPAMDRHRVGALLELLARGRLDRRREDLVREGVSEKARILASGARKRGHADRARFYASVAGEIGESRQPVSPSLLREAWRQVET